MGGLISSLLTCNIGREHYGISNNKIIDRLIMLEDRVKDISLRYVVNDMNEGHVMNQVKRLEDKMDLKLEIVNMKVENILTKINP